VVAKLASTGIQKVHPAKTPANKPKGARRR
jgi:hypothetical protein